MHDPDLSEYEEVLAARYVLGVATPVEIAQVHARLEDGGDFVSRVGAFCELFSDVELSEGTLAPSPELWARINTAIDDLEAFPTSNIAPPPIGTWNAFAPGIESRPVQVESPKDRHVTLYRMAAGTCFPVIEYMAAKECLLLDGDLEIGNVAMRVGDHANITSEAPPDEIKSRTGALIYIRAYP